MNKELLLEKFKQVIKTKYFLSGAPDSINIEASSILKNMMLILKNGFTHEPQQIELVDFIKQRIDYLNQRLSKFLNLILHNKKFQDLESKIRGLYYLITNVEHSNLLKIKVLNVSNEDIYKDLKLPDVELTRLFQLIYSYGLDTTGGEPMSLIVYDYYTATADSVKKLVTICAAAHAPLVTGVSPFLFNFSELTSINQARCDLTKILSSRTNFTALKRNSESRYLCLVLPPILGRAPYSKEYNPAPMLEFYNESFDSSNVDTMLWINPAFTVAVKVATSHVLYGWAASVLGIESGGSVDNLPVPFEVKNRTLTPVSPAQAQFTDRREKDLSSLGFIVLCHYKGTSSCVFYSMQTAHVPEVYLDDDATANSRLSSSLPNMLLASRFIHVMKIMLRNKIGSFQTKEGIEIHLQKWLSKYILLNDLAPHSVKAELPLRGAKVTVVDVPGEPGAYNIVAQFVPHAHFSDAQVSINLVCRLDKEIK
ncbi:hypothetical protein AB837_00134 [bacterium AB1]|nr:hypothetical protein AB837_00134 [bacterium AB1]